MPVQAWFVLAVLAGITLLIALDRVRPPMALFGGLALTVAGGVADLDQALVGFSDPAVLTVGALFVVAAAVRHTGALRLITRAVFGTDNGPQRGLVRLLLPTAFFSAFVNNTPIVAMFIPATRSFARRVGETPSRYLMPLGFAAMLGGTCTLIGTSANLVVSGRLVQAGLEPLGMLEMAWVGVPTVVLGLIYLSTVAWKMLGERQALSEVVRDVDAARQYLAELAVQSDSPLIGKSVGEAGLRQLPGLFLAEIQRADGRIVRPVAPQDLLSAGDLLVLSGVASSVAELRSFPGLVPVEDLDLSSMERHLFEVVVSHRSRMLGRTVREVGFRRRFDAAILAVHRAGERLHQRIGDLELRPGDTLLLSASPGFHETWRDSVDFYLVSALSGAEAPPNFKSARAALGVLGLLVVLPVGSTFAHKLWPQVPEVPIAVMAMLSVVALVAFKALNARQARQAVEFSVLIVIACALGLAQALELSGAAQGIADGLVLLAGFLPPVGLLALVYLLSVVAASLITNAAGAAIVFPIALSVAAAAGLDPRPFAVVVALAASAGFASPVGSNATLLVYGPGGYRFRDFVRVGLPLNVICLLVALSVVPLVWPLQP
ncbi:MAG: SLC13 family permease [Myxococcota bacterium]|nr:SLC13 family permease [Myxococcota bacterium]